MKFFTYNCVLYLYFLSYVSFCFTEQALMTEIFVIVEKLVIIIINIIIIILSISIIIEATKGKVQTGQVCKFIYKCTWII